MNLSRKRRKSADEIFVPYMVVYGTEGIEDA